MLKIGIYACENTAEIIEALLLILKDSNSSVAIKNNQNYKMDDILRCAYQEIDYILIPLNDKNIHPVTLDILILDNPNNKNIVTYELVDCISEDTILIYNTDNNYLPKLEHPNAIDYGFSQESTVSISSVEYNESACSFMLSVTKSFPCLCGDMCPIGEILITCNSDIKLENRIPAVICGIVCENSKRNVIKI